MLAVVPLLAAPAAFAVWLLPSPARWPGVLFGLAISTPYAWGLGTVAPGVQSWFVALYLPHEWQAPASIVLALAGGVCLLAAWRVRRGT